MRRTHENHFVEQPYRADQLDRLADEGWRLIGFSYCRLPGPDQMPGWLYVFVREGGA